MGAGTDMTAAGRADSRRRQRAIRTRRADRWLSELFGSAAGAALVAVGGYGRGELAPGSDLDVVLLHRDGLDVGALAERVWYPIWDAGVRLDHAVRTPGEAREAARDDIRVALGMLHARHVVGDPTLTEQARIAVRADWRARAKLWLPELVELTARRHERCGELAFLLEPDVKRSRGGLRDVHLIQAVAAAWVAPGPDDRVRAAYEWLLTVRDALHETTGRGGDRLVFQEQDRVAAALGRLDADALLHDLAEAGRAIGYAVDRCRHHIDRFLAPPRLGRRAARRPLADGLVDHDGAVALARDQDPGRDPTLILRAAATAATSALPLAPATLGRLAAGAPLPVPWPESARESLLGLLGEGTAAIPVWEALDQAGLVAWLLPDWERVRNRPQRDPTHSFTVDRHLVETAAHAASFTDRVTRPDLLLLAALFHDIGKGWPGDHSATGAVIVRDIGARIGLPAADIDVLATLVRHHLLLSRLAARRDPDDPATVEMVTRRLAGTDELELLHALTISDGMATGPAAWSEWRAHLVEDLVRRVEAAMSGRRRPPAPQLEPHERELAELGCPAVRVDGERITVAAEGNEVLWRAAAVLAAHRLTVRAASSAGHGDATVVRFTVAPEFGTPPEPQLLAGELRRALDGGAATPATHRHRGSVRSRAPVAPPRVTHVAGASRKATIIEVRARDEPGLLFRVAGALAGAGLWVRAARVDTRGGRAVDTFYLVDEAGGPVDDDAVSAALVRVRDALTSRTEPAEG